MKYIKKYDSYDFMDLKEYIILDISDFEHEIGELTILKKSYYDSNRLCLMTNQLYTFYNDTTIENIGQKFAVFLYDIETIILYNSDNLEDCLKMLPILANSNKYNI